MRSRITRDAEPTEIYLGTTKRARVREGVAQSGRLC